MNSIQRPDGRACNQIRTLRVTRDVLDYAQGSVLIELGKNKVLCAVTLQSGVPSFLRGKNIGWLTAEYAMLPAATVERTPRDINLLRKNGRAVEIARLIGRALRVITRLESLGEKTISIDCDVLQADGGTRTVSITGACIALMIAQERWLKQGIITQPILIDEIAAVSVGICNEQILLDPTFVEDAALDADFNFVLTRSGNMIEIQGGAEKKSVNWNQFDMMRGLAYDGIQQMFASMHMHNELSLASDINKSSVSHPNTIYDTDTAL